MLTTQILITFLLCHSIAANPVINYKKLIKPLVSLNDCLVTIIKTCMDKGYITVSLPQFGNNITDLFPYMYPKFIQKGKRAVMIITKNVQYHGFKNYADIREAAINFVIFLNNSVEEDVNIEVRTWNHAKAKFIIVTQEILKPNSIRIRDLFIDLSKKKILNPLLLAKQCESCKTWELYKWNLSTEVCNEFSGEVVHLEPCLFGKINKKIRIARSMDLKYQNCTIRAGYFAAPPYTAAKTVSGNSVNHGVEMDILHIVAKKLNYDVIYYKSDIMGEMIDDHSGDGNFDKLLNFEVDIVLGGYTKTVVRYRSFDSTMYYIADSLTVCIPFYPVVRNDSVDITRIFGGVTILISIILALILNGVLLYISNVILRRSKFFISPIRVITTVLKITITIACINSIPLTFSGYFAMILIIFQSFYLNQMFTIFIARSLLLKVFDQKYSSFEAILENNLTTYYSRNSIRSFNDSDSEIRRQYWKNCDDHRMCLREVAFNRTAVLYSSRIISEYMATNYFSADNDPLVYCYDNYVNMLPTMYMQKGSILFKTVTDVIFRITEGGFIFKWLSDMNWYKRVIAKEVLDISFQTAKETRISYRHLTPVFKILLICYGISIVIFFGEIVTKYFRTPFIFFCRGKPVAFYNQ
ncbi:Ionotropic receptor 104 [Diabrotica virgifera virgifera]|nr:Ionotropic receptor 104 [Diabrotica virgifera virgifera]